MYALKILRTFPEPGQFLSLNAFWAVQLRQLVEAKQENRRCPVPYEVRLSSSPVNWKRSEIPVEPTAAVEPSAGHPSPCARQ